MKIELDERALRRANPSRTTKLAVAGEDAFRDALAALRVAPANDVDAAAKLLAMLHPFEENHEALIEPVVAGVGRALGSTGLLRALMASNHADGRATLTHYDYISATCGSRPRASSVRRPTPTMPLLATKPDR